MVLEAFMEPRDAGGALSWELSRRSPNRFNTMTAALHSYWYTGALDKTRTNDNDITIVDANRGRRKKKSWVSIRYLQMFKFGDFLVQAPHTNAPSTLLCSAALFAHCCSTWLAHFYINVQLLLFLASRSFSALSFSLVIPSTPTTSRTTSGHSFCYLTRRPQRLHQW